MPPTDAATEAASEPEPAGGPETLPEPETPVEAPKTAKPASLNRRIMTAITSRGLSNTDVEAFEVVVTDGKAWTKCDDTLKEKFLEQITN